MTPRAKTAAVAVVAAAPAVVLAARTLTASWAATGDDALIELRTRAVGTSHSPLVGPYSRFGWNHPGPSLFFALALPYRLLSSHGTGLLAGAALVALVSIATMAVALWGSTVAPIVSGFAFLAVAVLLRALGAGLLWEPWNPYVIVLPFLAFVLLAWWIATGEDRALPVAVAFASFVVQTHVSVAAEALALLAVAYGWLVVTARRGARPPRLLRSSLLAAAVLAAMWALPVYQQVRPHGGNLGKLWRFWTASHAHTVGFGSGARLLAPQLSIPAPWMTGHEPVSTFSGALTAPAFSFPYALVALLAAAIVAWRRRDRIGGAAVSIAVVAVIAAWISIARIVDTPYPYLVRWAWVVGASCWIAAAVVLLPAAASRLGASGETWVARAFAAAACVVVAIVAIDAVSAAPPDEAGSRATRALAAQAIAPLRRLPQPLVFVSGAGGYQEASVVGGLVAGAVEHGLDARFPSSDAWRAPADRILTANATATPVIVIVGGRVTVFSHDPKFTRIAVYDSLTRAERREYDRSNRALSAALRHGSAASVKAYVLAHEPEIERLRQLAKRQYLAAVFVPRRAG